MIYTVLRWRYDVRIGTVLRLLSAWCESSVVEMQRTLFTLEMVMTMMAIGCVWSFLGEEAQVASEEAIVVVAVEVVTEVAEAGDLRPDVHNTGFL
jgi:hypothetical protein